MRLKPPKGCFDALQITTRRADAATLARIRAVSTVAVKGQSRINAGQPEDQLILGVVDVLHLDLIPSQPGFETAGGLENGDFPVVGVLAVAGSIAKHGLRPVVNV